MPVPTHVRHGAIAFVVSILMFPAAFAQAPDQHVDELGAGVPVLSEFHDVIYQIWHTAWPEKNIDLLVELSPQVKRYGDTLSRVTLTGILRDKQSAWDQGTAALKKTVAQYEAASASRDSVKLLDAAERVHSQYEALVRIIRPATKELDQFHQVLYMIYHHYWPNHDLEKLAPALDSLKAKMAALDASTLPSRLKNKEGAFNTARAELSKAVAALSASDAAKNQKKFASDLETAHSKYQTLEKVFE